MARGAGVALATLALLVLASPAWAATPQQIYRDLADNGRLDHHYSLADINRALHSPSLRGYERPAIRIHRPEIVSSPPAGPGGPRGSLPFSGLDVALFGGVGGPLLLLGASLGRVARVRRDGDSA